MENQSRNAGHPFAWSTSPVLSFLTFLIFKGRLTSVDYFVYVFSIFLEVGINNIHPVLRILCSAGQLHFEGSGTEDGEFPGTVSWKSANLISGNGGSPDRVKPPFPESEVLNLIIPTITTAPVIISLRSFFFFLK